MNGEMRMTRLLTAFAIGFVVFASTAAFAAEQTVTLAVKNMYCAACPHTVKASLLSVVGVSKVAISLKDKTALVTYDDAKTDTVALMKATTNAGYPSSPKS
jgi:periplasmic mercuric ion binding protein